MSFSSSPWGRALVCAALPWMFSPVFAAPGTTSNAAPASASSPSSTLSLTQVLALAQNQHLGGQVAAAESAAAQSELRQARIWRNPDISYSQERARSAGSRTETLQLNWPVELGGKRSARSAVAQSALALAQQEQATLAQQWQAQITALFYETLLAQESAEIAQNTVQLAQSAHDATAKKVQAGKLSPVESSKAQVALSSAQLELAQARSDEQSARAQLGAALGRALTEKLQGQAGVLPSLPDLAAPLQQLGATPAVQRARLQLEQRRAELALARSAAMPDATLSVGSKRTAGQPERELLVGISLPLPLFNREQGSVAAALSREQAATLALQLAEQNARASLQQTHARWQALHTQAQLLQADALPAAQSAYRAASLGFEYGKFSFLELLDAQRSYFGVQSQYVRTLVALHRTAAEWRSQVAPAVSTAPAAAAENWKSEK